MSTAFVCRCPTCAASTRQGLLWLGGGDWLTCPSCNGSGKLEGREHRFTPQQRTVFVPGLRPMTQTSHFKPDVALDLRKL